MADQPTYEDLKNRIEELEKEVSVYRQQKVNNIPQTDFLSKQKELFYDAMFNHGGFGIVIIEVDSKKKVAFNRIAHESLGYTREEYENLIPAIEPDGRQADDQSTIKAILDQGQMVRETKRKTKCVRVGV